MTPELTLIIILLKKEAFASFFSSIDLKQLKETSRELWFLYDALAKLHESTPNDLVLSELEVYFHSLYPESDRTIYEALFTRLRDAGGISEEVATATLQQYQQRAYALKLSEAAFQLSKGYGTPQDLQELVDGFKGLPEASKRTGLRRITTDIEELVEHVYRKPGLRWGLDSLNKSLGSLRTGDFGFIFARPETGKTTFFASQGSTWLKQGGYVDWFNNEEQGEKVMIRVYQSYFGIPVDKLFSNLKLYRERFEHETEGRFNLWDASRIHHKEVEDTLDDRPSEKCVVIYDQLTKIGGFKADRNDLELGEKFQWARELAKNRHAAVGCSQADVSAENQRWLTMDNVANAKTAVQAEADFIVGIGKVHDQKMEYVRFLNISKNKLIGDEDTVPELRHGRFEIYIEPQIAQYKDTMTYE